MGEMTDRLCGSSFNADPDERRDSIPCGILCGREGAVDSSIPSREPESVMSGRD